MGLSILLRTVGGQTTRIYLSWTRNGGLSYVMYYAVESCCTTCATVLQTTLKLAADWVGRHVPMTRHAGILVVLIRSKYCHS